MNCSCTPTESLLSKPQFLYITLHCLSFLEVFLHSFGAYCIIYKTPKSMKSIKWTMLNLHFWTVVLDFCFSGLLTPYMTLPALAGYTFGLFSYFGLHMAYQVYFQFSVAFTVGASICVLLESRYFLFIPTSTWSKLRIPYHILSYTFSFTFMIPQLTIMLPDQQSAIATFSYLLPCSIGLSRPVFGLNLSSEFNYLVIVVVSYNLHLFCIGVYFGFALHFHFGKMRLTSKLTVSLQSRLQIAMIIQISIPVTVLVGPVAYGVGSVLTGYHSQELNNIAMILAGCHGIVSTCAMLFIHHPYRLAIGELIPELDKYLHLHTTDNYRNRANSMVL